MFNFGSLDILFIVLAISVFFITIFLCLMLYHLIQILRDTQVMVTKTRTTVENINEYIAQPVQVIMDITEKVRKLMKMVKKEKKGKGE